MENPLCLCGCGQRVTKPTNRWLVGHMMVPTKPTKPAEPLTEVVIPPERRVYVGVALDDLLYSYQSYLLRHAKGASFVADYPLYQFLTKADLPIQWEATP